MTDIPREKYIRKLVGHPSKDEAAVISAKSSSTKAPCRTQRRIRHNDDSRSFRFQSRSLGPAR